MTKSNGIFQWPRLRIPAQLLLAGTLLLALLGSGLTAQANGGSGGGNGATRDGAHDASDGAEDDAAAVGGQATPTLATGSAAVINDEPVNLRSEAGTEAGIVAELTTGTAATVVGGPVEANGISWYQIETDAGTGWVAADYLTAASFAAGAQIVVTTDALNLRTAAGLDAEVVTTLGNGTTATIADGPTTVDGYTWYQVEADAGTGWVASEYLSPVAG